MLVEEFTKSCMSTDSVLSILQDLLAAKEAAWHVLKNGRMILTEQVLTLAAKLPENLRDEARKLLQEPCMQLAASVNGISDADIQPALLENARSIQG